MKNDELHHANRAFEALEGIYRTLHTYVHDKGQIDEVRIDQDATLFGHYICVLLSVNDYVKLILEKDGNLMNRWTNFNDMCVGIVDSIYDGELAKVAHYKACMELIEDGANDLFFIMDNISMLRKQPNILGYTYSRARSALKKKETEE